MVTSRYAELVEPGRFVFKEEDLTFNDDQVLVRITHVGVCQYDGSYFKGLIGKTPMRIGHEPVGVIEAVGRNVQGFQPGDRVHRAIRLLEGLRDLWPRRTVSDAKSPRPSCRRSRPSASR